MKNIIRLWIYTIKMHAVAKKITFVVLLALQFSFFWLEEYILENCCLYTGGNLFLFPVDPNSHQKLLGLVNRKYLTDEIKVVQSEFKITNLRWEHSDSNKKETSPTEVSLGDKITLTADFANFPEGHTVSLTVADKINNDLPPKFAFEVIARSKTFEQVSIGLAELEEFLFSL